MLKRIGVVVPAHDEHDLLPSCLAALSYAARRVKPMTVEIIVVADACADDSVDIARRAGAHVVTVDFRNVGRARAAGMSYALRYGPQGLWLATTDADSRVAPDWLRSHRAHAAEGARVVVGTVAVDDWTGWPESVRDEYETRYHAQMTAAGHRHVHGANLGCDARTYRDVGGFGPLEHDEDRDLVSRAHLAGARTVWDSGQPAVTSARRHSRAPAGFAAYLTTIDAHAAPG